MNTMTMNMSARPRAAYWSLRSLWPLWLARPLDAWSRRRVQWSAVVLAAIMFALAVQSWRAFYASDLDASRGALMAAQTKADATRRLVAELPDVRARVALGDLTPAHWSAADALRDITELAAQSGLRVTAIEPMKTGVDGTPYVERSLKFRADGAFAEIRRFLEALSGMPRLVVPERVQIRQQAGALGIEATLRVFDTLPAVARVEAKRVNAFVVDPFGKGSGGEFARGGDLLLVGTFVARHRAMALVQSEEGVDGFVPGQKIGDERVGRIEPRTLELAGDDGASRTLSLAGSRESGSFGRVASIDVASSITPGEKAVARKSKPRRLRVLDDADADLQNAPRQSGRADKRASASDAPNADGIPRYSIFDKRREAESRLSGKAARKSASTGDGK